MGIVFRARDTKLNRTVALKILPPDLLNVPGTRNRFYRAAKAASGIVHPNIAHVYEVAECNDLHFMAMEFVEGETLGQRLSRGPLDEATAVKIGMQIAEALEAAHRKGVIHRDIKPSNIVVAPRDHVKVLDFGLAKTVSADSVDAEIAETVSR